MANRGSTLTEQRYGLLSKILFTTKAQKNFQKYWHDHMKHVVCSCPNRLFESCTIYTKPFKICRIAHFIEDEKFLNNLMTEIEKLEHEQLTTDLYKFSRSVDLSEVPRDTIQLLYRAFQVDLALWLERNTGIKLNTKVTMTSSRYYDTDYLLCHDDNMSRTRKIAFILYLTDEWRPCYGGTLEIFDTDEHDLPRNIVNSIDPCYNSLVFFEVSDKSYHQVSEVLTPHRCRRSINGWFHGTIKDDRRDMVMSLGPDRLFLEPTAEVNLESWISDNYLSPDIMEQIHENMEQESYILLETFVEPSMFKLLAGTCEAKDISWQRVGPPNIRLYEIADEETLPLFFKRFCNVFRSISFFRLLKQYTGLDLIPDEQTMRPKMTLELQRWSRGCYTMLYDTRKLTYSESTKVARLSDDESLTDSASDTSSTNEDAASSSKSDAKSKSQTSRNKRKTKRSGTSLSDGTFEKVEPLSAEYSDSRKDTANCPSTDGEEEKKEDAESKRTKRNKRKKNSSASSSSDGTFEKVARCSDGQKDRNSLSANEAEEDAKLEGPREELSNNDRSSIDDDMESVNSDGSNAEYVLDVILQFHTVNRKGVSKTQDTLDYVDPNNENGVLIKVPQKDNHLLIVFRQTQVYRYHPYINHRFDGCCYNLVCTYRE